MLTAIQLGLVTSGDATGSVTSAIAASAFNPSATATRAASTPTLKPTTTTSAMPSSHIHTASSGRGKRGSRDGTLEPYTQADFSGKLRCVNARARLVAALAVGLALAGCEDSPKPNPSETPKDKPVEAPTAKEPSKPAGPPSLAIDAISPKVGFERENFQYPDGRKKLAAALSENRRYFEGQQATLIIDRKAKQNWVSAYLAELGAIGVPSVLVKTETRAEFPQELVFTPEARAAKSPGCSTVAMIMEDRGTAVWKLAGGVAGKRAKGMAGPDLSMTGETIERVGKACKTGSALFVAGAPEIEWGLIYDLAASTRTLSVHFDTVTLLSEPPVPGHKVDLTH